MDRLDAMRAFVAVATQGGFAGAARQLRLSPSAVTRAVAQIEDELGVTLFNRTTRIVRLTERGQIHLGNCRHILESVDAATAAVRGIDAAPRGLLTVAAPLLFGRLHVLPVVAELLAGHPELQARLVLADNYVNILGEGVDLAVRIGELGDSSLIATRLGSVCRATVASPAYLAARGTPATPADLADHDVIAFEGAGSNSEWHYAGAGTVRIRPRLSVNSADAAIAAAQAGVGITRTLSYQVRDAVLAGRLALLLPDYTPEPVPVSALFPVHRGGAPNIAAFIAVARARFRDAPLTPAALWPVAA